MKNSEKCIKYRILEFLSTWFYSGKSPKAPGTCGSLATLPFIYVIAYFYGMYGIVIFAVIISIIGIPVADAFAKALKIKDPGQIVIDEVAGQAITLIAAGTNLYLYALGFALFRLLDISKPLVIGWADRKVSGGLGIMLDDILAGIFGGLILWGVRVYLF